VADPHRPYRAGYTLSGIRADRIFAALLDVKTFPEWAVGLKSVRALDAEGLEIPELEPGTTIEFVLHAAGFSHTVVGEVSAITPPRLLEWCYVRGASGTGGWYVEETTPYTVELTLATDYTIKPAWLNKIAHRPLFKNVTEDLLRRSIRRFEKKLRIDC
jgi:uncharacterized membrane protein